MNRSWTRITLEVIASGLIGLLLILVVFPALFGNKANAAPVRLKTGVVVNTNSAGIVSTPGPYYGIYPSQACTFPHRLPLAQRLHCSNPGTFKPGPRIPDTPYKPRPKESHVFRTGAFLGLYLNHAAVRRVNGAAAEGAAALGTSACGFIPNKPAHVLAMKLACIPATAAYFFTIRQTIAEAIRTNRCVNLVFSGLVIVQQQVVTCSMK